MCLSFKIGANTFAEKSFLGVRDIEERQTAGCPEPSWKGDGYCDDDNNVEECEFDGGDCCGTNVDETFCSKCECLEDVGGGGSGEEGCAEPSWKGDGYCDDDNNIEGCEFDGGDCCGTNVDETFCNKCECLEEDGGGEQVGCAQIPSWMKIAIQQTPGSSRIIDGQTAPGPIPWQAHMRNGSTTGEFWYFCGGTIIDSKTILTAAHCYYGDDLNRDDFFIAAGAVHLGDSSAQTAYVESITLHESYNPVTLNNDIAILKLKTALTFNEKVRPACLPDASFNPEGIAVASGWGLIGQFPSVSPLNLHYVTKPVITNDKCTQPNTSWPSEWITAGMICAGDEDGGESACRGDSGGPLIVPKGSNDDTAVVIGATSWGPGECGTEDYPSVYAYVTYYLDWIKPKMEN